MEDTVFGKIIRRELPAEIVYEDDETLAFMNIEPVTPGHTLVIPKKPFRNIFDIDDETLAAVMRTVRKISPAVRDSVNAKGVHINSNHEAEAGQTVFHLHVHIIPRVERGTYAFWPKLPHDPVEASEIASRIRKEIA
ncbi:HIT family protein [Patescibacteria group bacterium]|nr:HIT family protein [Patescibacteria group bacterium]MBU1500421.1 HIT family protein [Patescibacteria group bacterium]MBU2080489.1 HIT family protein [Patescibacteria group bacterium]MBU2123706.1 HIT family protein [Patescibacteria group bacterium]MBU2194562.1 HIT family protein [Patescibacteria group bacterium]